MNEVVRFRMTFFFLLVKFKSVIYCIALSWVVVVYNLELIKKDIFSHFPYVAALFHSNRLDGRLIIGLID